MAEASPIVPDVHPTAHICDGAILIGRVKVGRNCFIGPNAVLRGDIEPLTMEEGSNVQDNCVLHTHAGNPVHIGKEASIGHGAVIHGATVEAHCIIGMNATVLDNAVVGANSVVGAGCVVNNGMQIPPRSLAVGVPAKIVKTDDDGIADMAYKNGQRYLGYRKQHIAGEFGVLKGPRPGVEE